MYDKFHCRYNIFENSWEEISVKMIIILQLLAFSYFLKNPYYHIEYNGN